MEFGDIFSARSNASHGKHSRGKARKPRARKDCSSLLSCHEILFSASFSRVSRFNTGDKLLPGAKTRVHTYVCALFMCHSAQHIPIYLSTSVSRTHTRVRHVHYFLFRASSYTCPASGLAVFFPPRALSCTFHTDCMRVCVLSPSQPRSYASRRNASACVHNDKM